MIKYLLLTPFPNFKTFKLMVGRLGIPAQQKIAKQGRVQRLSLNTTFTTAGSCEQVFKIKKLTTEKCAINFLLKKVKQLLNLSLI